MNMSRTIRKKYTKAKATSTRCRNHKDCPYCQSNRLFFDTRWRVHYDLNEQLEDFYEEIETDMEYYDSENY